MPDRMRPTGSDSVARSDGGTGRFLSRQEATGTYASLADRGLIPREFAVIGDSITLSGQGATPDDQTRNWFGDTWINYASVLSMGRIHLVPGGNLGITGNTTAQILARISTVASTLSAAGVTRGSVIYTGGTNDTVANTGAASDIAAAALTAANDALIVAAIQAAGHYPIIATIPPSASDGNQYRITLVNAQKRSLARRLNLPLVDFYEVLVNRADGHYKSGYNFDATHPGPVGIAAMGQAVVDALLPLLKPGGPTLAGDNSTLDTNFLSNSGTPNPLLLTATSPPTPDGWSFGGGTGYVMGLGACPWGAGNMATSIGSSAASSNNTLGVTIPASGNFSVGDVIYFGIGFQFLPGSTAARLNFLPAWTGFTSGPDWLGRLNLQQPVRRGVWARWGAVPSGTTALTVSLNLNGPGTLSRWQPTFINLTKTGITV